MLQAASVPFRAFGRGLCQGNPRIVVVLFLRKGKYPGKRREVDDDQVEGRDRCKKTGCLRVNGKQVAKEKACKPSPGRPARKPDHLLPPKASRPESFFPKRMSDAAVWRTRSLPKSTCREGGKLEPYGHSARMLVDQTTREQNTHPSSDIWTRGRMRDN